MSWKSLSMTIACAVGRGGGNSGEQTKRRVASRRTIATVCEGSTTEAGDRDENPGEDPGHDGDRAYCNAKHCQVGNDLESLVRLHRHGCAGHGPRPFRVTTLPVLDVVEVEPV